MRHVVLSRAADLDRADVQTLLTAALELAEVRLDARAKGAVILRAEARAQRARPEDGAPGLEAARGESAALTALRTR